MSEYRISRVIFSLHNSGFTYAQIREIFGLPSIAEVAFLESLYDHQETAKLFKTVQQTLKLPYSIRAQAARRLGIALPQADQEFWDELVSS